MAQLLISAAVNIAIGLVMNELFPPPDINQEGPRLTELGFTSATYGKFVNIIFGTDRVSGNIIDTTDPAIEEVVNTETSGGGSILDVFKGGGLGGGPTVNSTTYTYFLTVRVAWGIEGADELLRLWGDGKVIIDASGSSQILKNGVTHTFYPGGLTQVQDPEEVSRRGSDISAYRHLTTSKFDRMPLADYGNRIPNFTAEITYNSQVSTPVLGMVEPSSLNPPGSLSGADISYASYNPATNSYYSLKIGSTGTFAVTASDWVFRNYIGSSGFSSPCVGRDGFAYSQTGVSNSGPLQKVDIETGVQVATFGSSGLDLPDDDDSFGNQGQWFQLNSVILGLGIGSMVVHLNGYSGVTTNGLGSVVDPGLMPLPSGFTTPVVHTFSTADGFHTESWQLATALPDHDRGRMFLFLPNTGNNTYDLWKVTPTYGIGLGDPPVPIRLASVDITLVKQFSRGSISGGDDFEGTTQIKGWAINQPNGDLILSNSGSIVLYNPDTDTVLANRATDGFQGRNNYYSGDIIAYGISDTFNGTIRVIDTRTLETIRDIRTDDIPWPSGDDGVMHEQSMVWDDRVQAVMFSRVDLASTAVTDERMLKVFVNRVSGLGVGLDSVVFALSTSYQRQVMAGLIASDLDVTTLAGDTVLGYTLTRKSTMKSALQPLRARWDFDGVQSDWIMKFPKRGASSVLTIPEEDVGELKRGRDQTDTPAVQETRMDDLALPMRLGVRYRDKDTDYQIAFEHDKRQLFPNPTMSSKTELTLDVPIVDQAQPMKRMAQQKLWTAWNERITYKTVVPWTYIKLDATDVFSMGVFGETAQLRMGEMDVGAGWAIEVVGIVEDTRQYSSTVAAGSASGHVGTTVPSSLPTRLFPFDAPILSLLDLNINSLSNAYMVVSAFDDGWPGSSVLKSQDDVDYSVTGTVNAEAAIGIVQTAPSAWNIVNGDFPNRWQETEDGGTLVITALRRADAWSTAANEEIVLAGANTLGIIRASDDQVEVLSFETAVVNSDLTITLTRLLRGRLGTEDIADLGITVGDRVVLLSGATNVKEASPIIRQALILSELDTALFFKGVTIGTLLEDATLVSHIYTGRDLKPYFPVHPTAAADGSGGLDVGWQRRARGPLAAEWLDGTGEVVFNESIEEYRVALSTISQDRFVVKTVTDARIVNFTKAEVDLGGTGGSFDEQIMPVRDGFTEPDGDFGGATAPLSGGWVEEDTAGPVSIVSSYTGISGPPAASGNSTFMAIDQHPGNDGTTGLIYYNLDIVDELGMDLNNILETTFTMNMWCAMHDDGNPVPALQILLALYNDAGSNLGQVSTGVFSLTSGHGFTDGNWGRIGTEQDGTEHSSLPLQIVGVTGATKLRCRIQTRNAGTLFSTARFGIDVINISASGLAPGITVETEQRSETGLYSPVNVKLVT
jgi:hypothetical protein